MVLWLWATPLMAEVLLAPQAAPWETPLQAAGADRAEDALSVSGRLVLSGDDNLLPVLEADDDPLPPRLHGASTSRFLSGSTALRRLDYRDWQLTRGWGTLRWLHGNGAAGQLWLDLESNTQRGQRYDVWLQGHESKLSWWGLSRRQTFIVRGQPLEARLGVRLLEAHRYRAATLQGWYENDQFNGRLELLSSRGSDFSTAGSGYAVDLSFRTQPQPRLGLALNVEGVLGRLRWSRVRLLEADLASSQVSQDPQGFLHQLPVATGTERRFPLVESLSPRWDLSAAWTAGRGQWIATASATDLPTSYQLSYLHSLGNRQRLLATWEPNRNALGLTYLHRNLVVSVTSSALSLSAARRGAVALELRFS